MTNQPSRKAKIEPVHLEEARALKKLFAERSTLSQQAFGAEHGIGTQGMVWQYLNAGSPLNLGAAAKFARALGVEIRDFSPRLAEEAAAVTRADSAPSHGLDLETHPDTIAVRKVIFRISAGIAGFSVEHVDNGEGTPLFFSRAWAEKRRLKPENLYATRVSGSSMEPGLRDSDIVIVNTADTKRQRDAVFAVNHEGEFTVKRLRYEMRKWWLVSDNPDQRRYPPMECGDATYILGRVVLTQSESL